MPRWIWSRKNGRVKIVGIKFGNTPTRPLPELSKEQRIAQKRKSLIELLNDPDLAAYVFELRHFSVFNRRKKP